MPALCLNIELRGAYTESPARRGCPAHPASVYPRHTRASLVGARCRRQKKKRVDAKSRRSASVAQPAAPTARCPCFGGLWKYRPVVAPPIPCPSRHHQRCGGGITR